MTVYMYMYMHRELKLCAMMTHAVIVSTCNIHVQHSLPWYDTRSRIIGLYFALAASLSREAIPQHSHVSCASSNVHDDGIGYAGEESRTPHAVGGTRGECQNRKLCGLFGTAREIEHLDSINVLVLKLYCTLDMCIKPQWSIVLISTSWQAVSS